MQKIKIMQTKLVRDPKWPPGAIFNNTFKNINNLVVTSVASDILWYIYIYIKVYSNIQNKLGYHLQNNNLTFSLMQF